MKKVRKPTIPDADWPSLMIGICGFVECLSSYAFSDKQRQLTI